MMRLGRGPFAKSMLGSLSSEDMVGEMGAVVFEEWWCLKSGGVRRVVVFEDWWCLKSGGVRRVVVYGEWWC